MKDKAVLASELDTNGIRIGLGRDAHVVFELIPIPVIHDIDSRPNLPVSSLGVIGQTSEQAVRIIGAEVSTSKGDAIEPFAVRVAICSYQLYLDGIGTLGCNIKQLQSCTRGR